VNLNSISWSEFRSKLVKHCKGSDSNIAEKIRTGCSSEVL